MESTRRGRWSAAQAQAALADQERSGLTIQAFCQEHGWHPQRFYRWRRHFEALAGPRAEEESAAAPSFVRAELSMGRPVAVPVSSSPPAHFELVLCGGQRLCFSAEVDPIALVRTVQALEAGLC